MFAILAKNVATSHTDVLLFETKERVHAALGMHSDYLLADDEIEELLEQGENDGVYYNGTFEFQVVSKAYVKKFYNIG